MSLPRLGSDWEPLVSRVTGALGPELGVPPETISAVARWLDRVVEWNMRIDLTAARGADELVDLFVADAVVIAAASADSAGEHWVDVGSGAGAPAIPLALMAPQIRIDLVEPRDKRVAFLRSVQGALGLANTTVRRGRTEDLGAASYDVALARATLPPHEWLSEGTRIARRAVWVLLARGEVPEHAGWRSDRDIAYEWPLTRAPRRALRFVPAAP
jgi:16S rRNA (guanine527-N7)-methyltransferase